MELWARFDPAESRFRRVWFREAGLWNTFAAPVQKKTLAGGRCDLWITDSRTIAPQLSTLVTDVRSSQAARKLVLVQYPSPAAAREPLPAALVDQMTALDAVVLNSLLAAPGCLAADLRIAGTGDVRVTMHRRAAPAVASELPTPGTTPPP